MRNVQKWILGLCFGWALAVNAFALKFDGLAQTPPMGWNSWNTFECQVSESLIKETADAMVSNGMMAAGYEYVVIDDCWALRERDVNGYLVPDPQKFPNGMKALADYIHSKGLKLGIYGDAGKTTCAGYPGSQGHEYQDARTFAAWGIDFLKYDWCATGTRNAQEAYTTMRDALYAAKRPVVFSICESGDNQPWEWAQDIGHLWRISGDIYDCWNCSQEWSHGFKTILDRYHNLKPSVVGQDGMGQYSGPGHWNDADMLEVGNPGLTMAENRSHFTMWAMINSPLIAGNDLRSMNAEVTKILTHKPVIALNQDADGIAAWRFKIQPQQYEIWIKPLTQGRWAVAVLNIADSAQKISIEWPRMERAIRGEFTIKNLWSGKNEGTTAKTLTRKVGSHDVLVLELKPVKKH